MKRKLWVWVVLEYKGDDTRIVRVCSSQTMAERVKAKAVRETNLQPLLKGKNVKLVDYALLKFAVAGSKIIDTEEIGIPLGWMTSSKFADRYRGIEKTVLKENFLVHMHKE